MIWRESLPARVATATAGLLALVLMIITASSYVMTALMLRQGVDNTLRAALPVTAGSVEEVLEKARMFEGAEHEERYLQVLDLTGSVREGDSSLPIDEKALTTAQKTGFAFVSLVEDDDRYKPRRGPDWWQAITPREHELRVMYALVEGRHAPVVLQMATPIGPVGEVLPGLFIRLAVLAGVGLLISSLIAWRMSAQTYRPLQAVTATAADISTQTLSLRIPDIWRDRTLRRLIGVLNDMIARLQGAFEAQGRFVAAAAHELRGPLGAMRAEMEVTLRRERTPAEYREALQGALEETARLATLSEHLLMLARYDRGAGLAMERDIPLSSLLERTAAEVKRSVGGELQLAVPANLTLDGDPLALERLVANLARNGIEAGGCPVRITAEGGPFGPGPGFQAVGAAKTPVLGQEGIWIRVADQGPGIPAEVLPNLFEPFYRADPARSRDGGTGLGLAIVKTVVEAHGGQIRVESMPGQGTVFHCWLPRHQPGLGGTSA